MKKVILAFSGGLDTSFSIPYLMEKGYEVITLTVNTGGLTDQNLTNIAQKSKKLGASKHYQINGQNLMFDKIVSYIVKTEGLYQDSYPNMCTDRYVIAEEAVKIAQKEKVDSIAHGSSAMGNDQVRFDVALMTIAPDIKIVTPIREMGGNRQKEQEYLEKKGFSVPSLHKKYSVNQNILGVTYSGSEIDKVQEPDEEMFLWTKPKKTVPTYLTIGFEKGVPNLLNNNKTKGVEILKLLNKIVGGYGFGRNFYTGDCVIGIKGHIAIEAPGVLTLIEAHKALRQLVLTKHQQVIGKVVDDYFTDLLFTGKFYEPAIKDLKAFIDSREDKVTGTVKIKLKSNQITVVDVKSPYSLINPQIATYAQGCTWTAADAEGFIKLYGLQGKISANLK